MKKCFTCKCNKPLFLFHRNRMKYQIASDKGRAVECRLCCAKRLLRQDGTIVKYNFDLKKFEIIYIKPTILNAINQYL